MIGPTSMPIDQAPLDLDRRAEDHLRAAIEYRRQGYRDLARDQLSCAIQALDDNLPEASHG